MLNRLAQNKCSYGLDIGVHKIKACALSMDKSNELEIAGIYESETHGFGDQSVTDLNELSESIHRVIEKLVNKTGIKAKEVQLGINGDLIFVRPTQTMIPLVDRGNKVISKKDIKKVNHQARILGTKMEEEILHELPMGYIVDDSNLAINPLGLYGRTLGVEMLLIGTKSNSIKNISKAVHQAGYDVSGVHFSSYAAISQVVTDAQKIQGVALIDIGTKVTSILVFHENVLKHVGMVQIGGDHFTKSISEQVNLSYELAEEIKKSYALAIGSTQHYEEEILVKKENTYIPIKRELICRAIQPSVSQLCHAIHEELKISGLLHQLNQGVTLIGGGALLPGLIECVGEQTGLNAQLGKILIEPNKNIGNSAVFASVVGLAKMGMNNSQVVHPHGGGENGVSKHFLGRIVELYNEYF